MKGETSGHRQWVREVRLDCDGDTVLVKVHQEGGACHTGDRTCFDRRQAAGSGRSGEESAPVSELSPTLEEFRKLAVERRVIPCTAGCSPTPRRRSGSIASSPGIERAATCSNLPSRAYGLGYSFVGVRAALPR